MPSIEKWHPYKLSCVALTSDTASCIFPPNTMHERCVKATIFGCGWYLAVSSNQNVKYECFYWASKYSILMAGSVCWINFLSVWAWVWSQDPMATGTVRRQFKPLSDIMWRNNGISMRSGTHFAFQVENMGIHMSKLKCHVIILNNTDMPGFVVIIHWCLCLRIWLPPPPPALWQYNSIFTYQYVNRNFRFVSFWYH